MSRLQAHRASERLRPLRGEFRVALATPGAGQRPRTTRSSTDGHALLCGQDRGQSHRPGASLLRSAAPGAGYAPWHARASRAAGGSSADTGRCARRCTWGAPFAPARLANCEAVRELGERADAARTKHGFPHWLAKATDLRTVGRWPRRAEAGPGTPRDPEGLAASRHRRGDRSRTISVPWPYRRVGGQQLAEAIDRCRRGADSGSRRPGSGGSRPSCTAFRARLCSSASPDVWRSRGVLPRRSRRRAQRQGGGSCAPPRPGPLWAESGRAPEGARPPRPGLRLVHRRLRHAGPAGGEGAAR